MTTVLSHFYNEEYLLPFWLNHHKKYFDHGIMINYGSTDRSVDIIKEICPSWEVVESKNQYFEAVAIDEEVIDYESRVSGFKICLNTTEFLLGNFNTLKTLGENTQLIIPAHYMVDMPETSFQKIKESLFLERSFGIFNDLSASKDIRRSRSFHNYNVNYFATTGAGRHFKGKNTDDFLILYYGFCPLNDYTINRKLAFNNKLKSGEKLTEGGVVLNKEFIINKNNNFQSLAENLYDIYSKFL